MRLTATEIRAKQLSQAVRNLGTSTKKSLSERAGILATIKGAPTIRGEDGKTPVRGVDYFTPEDIKALKAELLDPEHITEIIKVMKSLPDSARLEVSDIRNYQSFIFNKTKYGVHEMMHGGSSSTTSSISFETPVGLVDDSNVSFSVTHEPAYIIVNGGQYTVGNGLYSSYLAGVITLTSAVGTGGFIISAY